MLTRLRKLWDNLISGLWFVPAMLVLGAACLAEGLTLADRSLQLAKHDGRSVLFSGTAESARALLSTIGGALVTVVSLVFSITFVALSQVSMQFTPRLLRNFMRDRINQVVLGAFVGGFIYCVLVLRHVRSEDSGDAFVPSLSVTTAIGVALACIGLLVLFFHHVSRKLQIAVILQEIHRELEAEIDRIYPDELGDAAEEEDEPLPDRPGEDIICSRNGFLTDVDEQQLRKTLQPLAATVHVLPRVGHYVTTGDPLVRIWRRADVRPADASDSPQLTEQQRARIRNAFVFAAEQSLHQDVMFGLRQLSDVALRALSPGVNDPTTAEHAIRHMADVLGRMAGRAFPPRWRRVGECMVCAERPEFADYLSESFGQIGRAAARDPHVVLVLLGALRTILDRTTSRERAAVIIAQARHALDRVVRDCCSPAETQRLKQLRDEMCGREAEMASQQRAPASQEGQNAS